VRLQPLGHLSDIRGFRSEKLTRFGVYFGGKTMPLFEQFIRERRYLQNISPSTVSWYSHALKWLPTESPTQAELKETVLRMREKGLKATGCNSAIRAINAYLKWSESPLKIPQMKEPEIVLPTFSAAQVKRLIGWKPRGFYERRLHLLVLVLLDTGCRITEALTLRVRDIDLDNLLVTLDGKGRKQRVVPFSFELRKALCRYIATPPAPDALLFATRRTTRVSRHSALRSVKLLCKRLGFDPPDRTLHATHLRSRICAVVDLFFICKRSWGTVRLR
jgi:integrase